MMPLIDVIFLLLTFFIYSMVVMVYAKILPVQLTPLTAGGLSKEATSHVITIDRDGVFHFDGDALANDELDQALRTAGSDPEQPAIFVTVSAEGRRDRGPRVVELIERVQAAGVTNMAIVGQPAEAGP